MGFGTRFLIVVSGFLVLLYGGQYLREGYVSFNQGGEWWSQVLVFAVFALFAAGIAVKWDEWARPNQGLTSDVTGTACFCGCGKFVPHQAGQKSNALGASINEALAYWLTVLTFGKMLPGDMEADHKSKFVQDGWRYREELRKATHLGNPPERELRKKAKRWLEFSDSAKSNLRTDPIFASLSFRSSRRCSAAEIEAWAKHGEQPEWLVKQFRK